MLPKPLPAKIDAKQIYMAEWLTMRPYDLPIKGYDQGYVAVCNKIYPIVQAFTELLPKDAGIIKAKFSKTLAMVLVSYLEDFVNEIGLWKTVTDENTRSFGLPLGIITLSDSYSTADINEEDIRYLLWHYTMLVTDKEQLFYIESDRFKLAAQKIYAIFDDALENEAVETSNFYEKFLTITEKTDFFDIKSKYDWVSFGSYLCAMEFFAAYRETIEKLQNKPDNFTQKYLSELVYLERNKFYYKKNSSMAALPTRLILAQIARTSESIREKIRETNHYAQGMFFMHKQLDKKLIDLQIIGTKERILLNINSINVKGQKHFKPKTTHIISLVKWGEEYWQSGISVPLGGVETANNVLKDKKTNQAAPSKRNPTITKATVANLHKIQAQHTIVFQAYFGSLIVFTQSEAKTQTLMNDYFQWQNDNMPQTEADGADEDKAMSADYWQKCADTPKIRKLRAQLPEITDYYFMMVPGSGITLNHVEDLKEVPRITKKGSKMTQEDGTILFECIIYTHPMMSSYLFQQYDFSSFGFRMGASPQECAQLRVSLPALQRFYQPDEYHLLCPEQSVIDTEALDTPFV